MSQVIIDAMYSLGKSDAKDLRMRAHSMDGTAIIAEESKIPDFVPRDFSDWPVGSPVRSDGQIYGLKQPYDGLAHPQKPAEIRAHWDLLHTKDPYKAKPYVAPLGTSGRWFKDECYLESPGVVCVCNVKVTDFNAEELPSAWIRRTI